MRYLLSIITLIAAPALATVQGQWEVNLIRGSTTVAPASVGATQDEAWNACQARIPNSAAAKTTYKCQTPRYVAVVTPDPTCPAAPPSTTRVQQCAAPTTGTWTQTSSSTVGAPPACTVTTTWSPSSPPAGACTPPTCPPLPAAETRSQQCPSGTTGMWTQTRTYSTAPHPTCSTPGDWLPTSPPAGACTALPPPSGDTIRNGQAFTVTGSGFGTKTTPGPVVFDDFESGSGQVQNKSAVVGTWGGGEHPSPTYDTTQPLQGAKVARHAFGSGTYNVSLYVDRAATTYYLDYWMRLVPRSGTYSRNFKPWRIYGANDRSWANDVVFCDSPGWVGTDWGLGAWVPHPEFQKKPVVIPRQHGIWEHYRVAVKSGPGALFSQHRNGVLDVSETGNQTTANAQGVRIGHYWALDATDDGSCNANSGADVYTDLVYVDTSLARVYLADAATLVQAKHTAIQIATAWADSAVTVKANTHGFKPGSSAHVIVIDAANAQRGSKQVTVIAQ